jgi:opacity protein-like surface antigen
MKRFLIAALLLVAVSTAASARDLSSHYLGLKGGINYMKLSGEDVENVDFLTAFSAGIFYQYNAHPRIAISPEINFSIKGANNPETDVDLVLGYVEVPLLVKILFPTRSTVTPWVYGGGYISYLVSAEIDGADSKEEFADTDAGLLIGGGLDLRLAQGRQLLNLDIRLTYGMTPLDTEGEADLYNVGFQFLLGWGFNL